MNDEMPHDDELRALYRKLPPNEPRAQLDDAILAAARKRATESRRIAILRRVRWSVSLAAAAGVVLTLTLTKLTTEQNPAAMSAPRLESRPFLRPKYAPPGPPVDVLEEREARREDAPAAAALAESAAPAKDAASGAVSDRKQEVGPLAKGITADRAKPKPAAAAKPVENSKARSAEAKAPEAPPFASLGGATVPSRNDGAANEPAQPAPSENDLSQLRSLGYIAGGEAAQPAAPPPGADEARDAAKTDSIAGQLAAPAPAAPAAPPASSASEFDISPSKGVKGPRVGGNAAAPEEKVDANKPAATAAPDTEGAKESSSAPESDDVIALTQDAPPGRQPPPPVVEILPFGLEAGLDAEEACRRVTAALHVACAFYAGLVELNFDPPVLIDRGRLDGKLTSRLSLGLRDGTLGSVGLMVVSPDGNHSWEALLTPPPPSMR